MMNPAHALVLLVLCAGSAAADAAGDFTVTVSMQYPAEKLPSTTQSASLRGDSCGLTWDADGAVTMTQSTGRGNDTWSVELTCGAAEAGTTMEMKVLLDNAVWMIGANHHFALEQGAETTVFPWFFAQEGSFQMITDVYSPQLDNTRQVTLYLPPSYTENTYKPYSNVLVAQDGQNLFFPERAAYGCWYLQDTLNPMIVNAAMAEVVVVGVDNTPQRLDEYAWVYDPSEQAGGRADDYLDFLEQTVMPLVTSTYPRITPQRDTLGLLGSSMGGLLSCYGAWTRDDVYGLTACMSSSLWWDDEAWEPDVIYGMDAPATPHPHFYLDSGNSAQEKQIQLLTLQMKRDLESDFEYEMDSDLFYYLDDGGTHDEKSWGTRVHIPLADLYPPTLA